MTFQCLRCAECCSWRGYVYISARDTDRIAEYLGIDTYDFTERFTRLPDNRQKLSLVERSNGECVFLKDKHCRIYPARPKQCADFPLTWTVEGIEHICAATIKGTKDQRLKKKLKYGSMET